MIVAGPLLINVLPLLGIVLLWLLTSQSISVVLAQLAGRSLIAWNVGLFGISAIYLNKPRAIQRFAHLLLPPVAGAEAIYWVMGAEGLPVLGLPSSIDARLWLAIMLTLGLGFPRIVGALRELRFPLWGEARMLDRVARYPSIGGNIYFTAVGRAYIRDRFGASPEEFIRIIRHRQTPLATESNRP